MTEVLTTVAVGIGVVGLIWLKIQDLRRDIGGKIDDWRRSLGGKIDAMRGDLSNVKAELGEVKGKIDLIAQGLHIEIPGRSRT